MFEFWELFKYFEIKIILISKQVSLFIYLLTHFLDLNLDVDVCFVIFMNVDIIYNIIIMKENPYSIYVFIIFFQFSTSNKDNFNNKNPIREASTREN